MPKKIPTWAGIIGVLLITVLTGFLFNILFERRTQASRATEPRDVEITNISDIGATVIWTTSDPATGAVLIGDSVFAARTVFDDRDRDGTQRAYRTHSATIAGLTPDTAYSFIIISAGKQYEGAPEYSFRTAASIEPKNSGFGPIYGTVYTPDKAPGSDAIVIAALENSQMLSSVTDTKGAFMIPANSIRTADFTGFLTRDMVNTVSIRIRDATSTTTILSGLSDVAPLPPLTIGTQADLRLKPTPTAEPAPSPSVSPSADGKAKEMVLGTETKKTVALELTIRKPQEQAILVSDRPLIEGTGVSGSTVTVTIGIKNPITKQLTVADDGIWRMTPDRLDPGLQSITVTGKDRFGLTKAVTRMFEILKSGSQVLGEATGSGNIATTPTSVPTPTTVQPSATPEPEPSPEPTPEPTGSIASTSSAPVSEPPVTGVWENTVIIMVMGMGMLLTGIALFLL